MSKIPVSVGQTLQVEILDLSYGGAGIARPNGFVVFVPFTAPGDLVEIRVIDAKPSYATGRLEKIVSPSANRTTPKCPHFGECGGCSWQHVSYDTQLIQKQKIVETAFQRARIPVSEYGTIFASPKTWNYRNRIQVHKTEKGIGFKRRKSHSIVDINSCDIADERLLLALKKADLNALPFEKIDVRLNAAGEVKIGSGESSFDEIGFGQINTEMNTVLIDTVLLMLEGRSFDVFIDLYAGSGNLTFPIYQYLRGLETVAVELSRAAVDAGTQTAKNNNWKNITFIESNCSAYLRHQPRQLNNSLVVLDPPRDGCESGVIEALLKMQPKHIIYVSCDPMTLTRDLGRLLSSGHFKVLKVQPLDMFPQTDHIETIVSIQRQ